MWKPVEKSEVENLDNYLSAIDDAKRNLAKINDDIKIAIEQKSSLIAGNDRLFKEKLEDIDHKRKDVEAILAQAKELKFNHDEKTEYLHKEYTDLDINKQEHEKSKAIHVAFVQNKEKEFLSREQDILDLDSKLKDKDRDISSRTADVEQMLSKIEEGRKDNQSILNEALKEKKAIEDYMNQINEKMAALKTYAGDIERKREESDNKLIEAQKSLEEARILRSKSEFELAEITKQKASFNDLIIESKKAKVDAVQATQVAQRNIADANQKIAELKELKEAMAQQEK